MTRSTPMRPRATTTMSWRTEPSHACAAEHWPCGVCRTAAPAARGMERDGAKPPSDTPTAECRRPPLRCTRVSAPEWRGRPSVPGPRRRRAERASAAPAATGGPRQRRAPRPPNTQTEPRRPDRPQPRAGGTGSGMVSRGRPPGVELPSRPRTLPHTQTSARPCARWVPDRASTCKRRSPQHRRR